MQVVDVVNIEILPIASCALDADAPMHRVLESRPNPKVPLNSETSCSQMLR